MSISNGAAALLVDRRSGMPSLMNLKILLPFTVFAERTGVARIVVDTREGSLRLMPHRLDCVAAVTSGTLVYETEAEGEVYLAVDDGVLVKTGANVWISVRRAIGGSGRGQWRDSADPEILAFDEQRKTVRSTMARLDAGFLRRFATFRDE